MTKKIFLKKDGFIEYHIDNNLCFIDYIEVTEDKRKNGIGRKMLSSFINQFSSNTLFIEAFVDKNNPDLDFFKLIKFYESLGFKKDEKQFNSIKESDEFRIFLTKNRLFK